MNTRLTPLIALLLVSLGVADEPRWIIGSANPDISDGARALLGGRNEVGIRLTLKGLENANNEEEEEVALSNLCAGYTNMGEYDMALKYCDILLQRNDKVWQAYNSKALIFINTKQYDKAEEALLKGEAINPDARSMKIARALYLDATQPVIPEVQVDDREPEIQ